VPGAANLDSIEATIADRGINCDFERTGELDVALEPWQLEDLRDLHETLRGLGEESELLDEAQTRALVSSPTYLGGSLGWEGRCGVGDSGNQFHYYRLTSDDRLVFGGYDALYYYGSDLSAKRQRRPETEQLLYRHLLETFPGLRGVRITHTWGGAIDTSTRFSASWQRGHGGRVVSVLGYTGLGVGASRFGAQVCLDLLAGRDNERTGLEMVRTKPVPFPPEPARSLGINLTRSAMAKADRSQGRRNAWLRTLDRFGLGFDS